MWEPLSTWQQTWDADHKRVARKCGIGWCDEVPSDKVHLVLGGEVALWTEHIDPEHLMEHAWPRASAAAERLWSSMHLLDPDAAEPRLKRMACRLVKRGINVAW